MPIFLLNCRQCDDLVKLVEKPRKCECEASRGVLREEPEEPEVLGPALVLTIDWETYDGIGEGQTKSFSVLRKTPYRPRRSTP